MYATLTELLHLLLTLPLFAVLACGAVAVVGFRAAPTARLRRWRWPLALATLVFYAGSTQVTSNALLRTLESSYAVPGERLRELQQAKADVRIVVLSGGWFRSAPGGLVVQMGANSWERTWAGVRLWRQLGGRLIVTGAPLPDGSDSVARHMAELALALGVPAGQLDVETESRNTYENLLFTQRRLLTGTAAPVVLVTSALHLPRAVAIAQHLGLAVLPVPCDWRAEAPPLHWRAWLPSNEGASQLEEVLHEIVGLWVYRWRAWA